MCNSERGWAFERMIGSSIDGFDHKTVEGIDGRGECGRLCLLETAFDCRSAEYNFESKSCILSREDRRTQPEAFRTNTPGIDYIENQCAKGNILVFRVPKRSLRCIINYFSTEYHHKRYIFR